MDDPQVFVTTLHNSWGKLQPRYYNCLACDVSDTYTSGTRRKPEKIEFQESFTSEGCHLNSIPFQLPKSRRNGKMCGARCVPLLVLYVGCGGGGCARRETVSAECPDAYKYKRSACFSVSRYDTRFSVTACRFKCAARSPRAPYSPRATQSRWSNGKIEGKCVAKFSVSR